MEEEYEQQIKKFYEGEYFVKNVWAAVPDPST